MSKITRPLQYLDANNNVIPHEASKGSLRLSYEGGSNLRYHGSSRPNKSQMSNADFEAKVEWSISRLTYSGSNVIRNDWISGTNDNGSEENKIAWDNGANTTITNVTQANPGVLTVNSTTWSDGTDIADGDKIEITGVGGMVELNSNTYFIDDWNPGAMTFTLNVGNNVNVEADDDIDTSGFTAFASNGVANKRSYLNYTYN